MFQAAPFLLPVTDLGMLILETVSCNCVLAAQVSLEKQSRGSGFISHPAVVDSCMQMGPAIGALSSRDKTDAKAVTRVVAGLAGFHSVRFPQRSAAFAASEMLPPGPAGEIYTSHWLIGSAGRKSLAIKDLKAWFFCSTACFSWRMTLIGELLILWEHCGTFQEAEVATGRTLTPRTQFCLLNAALVASELHH